jgi:hypothetical protein
MLSVSRTGEIDAGETLSCQKIFVFVVVVEQLESITSLVDDP